MLRQTFDQGIKRICVAFDKRYSTERLDAIYKEISKMSDTQFYKASANLVATDTFPKNILKFFKDQLPIQKTTEYDKKTGWRKGEYPVEAHDFFLKCSRLILAGRIPKPQRKNFIARLNRQWESNTGAKLTEQMKNAHSELQNL